MKKLSKEFQKLKKVIPTGSNLYLEIDLIKLKDFFLKYGSNLVLKIIFQELKKIIGKNGNLIVPAFSYSWGDDKRNKIFKIKKTRPETGIFPNYLLNKSGVIRTKDPMFSFLIFGKDKNKLKNIGNSSFGKKSLYEKINNNKTYLVSFGLNKFDPTFVHYVEEYFDGNFEKINYRFLKKFSGFFERKSSKKKHFFCFARNLKLNKFFDEKNIKSKLMKKKQLKKIIFNGFDVYITKAPFFFKAGIEGMKKNINFFVK